MNEQFSSLTASIPDLFAALANGPAFQMKATAAQRGKAGVYAFFENEQPVHVGRTGNLQGRLRGHGTVSHYSATFAFKRTRRVLGVRATYTTAGSRSALVKDEKFGPEFLRQIASVKAMRVRFIEVSDPVVQYLLELYAHLEWNLPLDEFDTH